MKPSRDESIESALALILDALARLLIDLAVTPAKVAHVARTSFVKAAARRARIRTSGRPHLARIASMTGLPRSEVKRIVAEKFAISPVRTETLPRALRVLRAWEQSSGYSRGGRPIAIKIVGGEPSFVALCRDHSGDIPYRVILDELVSSKLATLNKKKTHISATKNQRATKSNAQCQTLIYAAEFLQHAMSDDAVIVRKKQRVRTSSTVPSAYVEKAVAGRVSDLMDQLPNLFPERGRRTSDAIDVFTVVARSKKSKD